MWGLHRGQREVAAHPARFKVLRCGRRWGKTIFGMERAVWTALAGKRVGWFAPTYKYLLEPWQQIERVVRPVADRISTQERQMLLDTGGQIEFWSLEDPDAGRSRHYDLAVIDECDRAAKLEEAWLEAIRPTLTDNRGAALFLGTPKGRRYLTTLYAKGQSGDPEWCSWNFNTVDNPAIDPSEVEAARRDLPPHVFAQEYEGTPADDDGNPFGPDAIRDCTVDSLASGEPVAWGWDLAKSVDWTVGIGLSESGEVCAFERFQRTWKETEQDILRITSADALIDSTGVGDPIVEALQRQSQMFEGFKFTSTSKQQLMDRLRTALHRREISFPDGPIRQELDTFEYKYTATGVRYTAPDGLHDDCVMALALAVKKWSDLGYGAVPAEYGSDLEMPKRDVLADLIKEEMAFREQAFRAGR